VRKDDLELSSWEVLPPVRARLARPEGGGDGSRTQEGEGGGKTNGGKKHQRRGRGACSGVGGRLGSHVSRQSREHVGGRGEPETPKTHLTKLEVSSGGEPTMGGRQNLARNQNADTGKDRGDRRWQRHRQPSKNGRRRRSWDCAAGKRG